MNIDEIQANPNQFIKNNKKKDIITFLQKADEAFFNSGNVLVSDDIYDIIKDYIREQYPKDAYLKRIGADETHKVKLPFYLGSQNKIKDNETEINRFKQKYKGQYVISDKMDGISCLIIYNDDDIKIYTRGNGVEGQDISHIIEYVKGIPKLKEKSFAVRGELIISKKNWEKLKDYGANARNVVAGAINSKVLNKTILNNIEFVAYTLLEPNMELSKGLQFIKKSGINTVRHYIEKDITLELLSKYLIECRKSSEYEIDGIVIVDDNIHPNIKNKNPEHSFAFKSIHTHEQVEVIVSEVEWNISKDKYIKPIVKFNEIDLDGVKIKQASGFNGSFIEKNKIGAGSRIVIIRSGGVIPHIHQVLTSSANGQPSFPKDISYKWNETHVDILLDGSLKNREHDIQEILYFMKTLEIENLGIGMITKIYDKGYDTLKKIINITIDDLLEIDGIKEKLARKVFDSIQKVHNVDCLKVMDASNVIGRGLGIKKIKLITDTYPFILKQDASNRNKVNDLRVADLIKIQGIFVTTAISFLKNIKNFHAFYDELGIKCINNVDEVKRHNDNITGKTFVFSGFRDKNIEKLIEQSDGHLKNTVSKYTDYLIVSNKIDRNAKVLKAEELNITIVSQGDDKWNTIFNI